MSLLEEIREISGEAAHKLERAGFCTDSDIRTLTQCDLQELLPGISNFRTRKKIYETIQKRHPIHVVLNELKSFVPDEFLRDALSNNGPLYEYLQTLKKLKFEMNNVQEFLDAHIKLLEKYVQTQDTKSNKVHHASAASSATLSGAANTNHQMDHFYSPKAPTTSHMEHHFYLQNDQATVKYKMVVSGNTLDRHLDVMEKLKGDVRSSLNLQETQRDEDSQVIIVFCPVVSRAGTDVETALRDVSVAKPVILVMMHHSRKAQTPPTVKPCIHAVMLVVNVFFHETVPGLLKCPQNDEAIVSMQTKLQLFSTG